MPASLPTYFPFAHNIMGPRSLQGFKVSEATIIHLGDVSHDAFLPICEVSHPLCRSLGWSRSLGGACRNPLARAQQLQRYGLVLPEPGGRLVQWPAAGASPSASSHVDVGIVCDAITLWRTNALEGSRWLSCLFDRNVMFRLTVWGRGDVQVNREDAPPRSARGRNVDRNGDVTDRSQGV